MNVVVVVVVVVVAGIGVGMGAAVGEGAFPVAAAGVGWWPFVPFCYDKMKS